MKLLLSSYQRYALEMENDQDFYKRYLETTKCGPRRSLIRSWIYEQHERQTDIEDGEQLRRYFDDKWQLAYDADSAEKYAYLNNVWDNGSIPSPKPKKVAPAAPTFTSTPKEDPIMAKTTTPIEVTTKTLVNGTDVSTMTDSEIYALIASEEALIEDLKKIKAQPKRLVAEIEKRQAGINALVAYLDSKE